MLRQKRNTLFGLKSSLEQILDTAKKSKNQGDKRTEELRVELRDIHKRIKETLEKINREAETSTDAAAQLKAQSKQEATLEILQAEMVRLAALYHRQSDVEMIQHFIRDQRAIIGTSMEATARKPSLVSLDTRIGQLYEAMAEERANVRRNARKDWIKFWVSVTIGLFSLSISIYALAFR